MTPRAGERGAAPSLTSAADMWISGLFSYPIKSAAGVALESVEIGALGPEGDRRYMVVTPEGEMITQRQAHRLALLRPTPTARGLLLDAPGMPRLAVAQPRPAAPRRRVRVWSDEREVALVADPVAAWLSAFLGRPARLVFMPDDVVRPVDPRYGEPGDRVSFADGFSLLLASDTSLGDLNARLVEPVGMERFRPNIVVGGAAPWAEDGWASVSTGGLRFDLVKPCARCVMTTIDQATARASREPLRTLATFRRRGGAVLFGQNLIHRGRGRLSLGAPVIVEPRT